MLWLPERDFWPFWPRPAVLPLPEPWPRPTRFRSRWLPSAGFSSWRVSSVSELVESVMRRLLLHRDHGCDAAQHALEGRRILMHGALPDTAQAERPQRAAVFGTRADR